MIINQFSNRNTSKTCKMGQGNSVVHPERLLQHQLPIKLDIEAREITLTETGQCYSFTSSTQNIYLNALETQLSQFKTNLYSVCVTNVCNMKTIVISSGIMHQGNAYTHQVSIHIINKLVLHIQCFYMTDLINGTFIHLCALSKPIMPHEIR